MIYEHKETSGSDLKRVILIVTQIAFLLGL